MQSTILQNEELSFHVKITISSTIIANEVEKELMSLSKKVKLDGFRAGKIPISIIKQKYKQSVRRDIIQRQISHNIQQIVNDHKLNVIGDPQIEDLQNEEDKNLEFVLKFELLPKIQIADLNQIVINKPKIIIKDDDIDREINRLAELSKDYTIKNNEQIKKGEQVIFDAICYIDDEPFEDGKIIDYKLVIGSEDFINGFGDQLIGAKIGDQVKVKVTLPQDYYNKHIANKPAKFIVTIKACYSAEAQVINDEFATKFNYVTLEDLRKNIAEKVELELKGSIHTWMKMSLFDQLENLLTFNVPQSLLMQEKHNLKFQAEQNRDEESLFADKSEQEISEYYNKLALRRIKVGLMLAEYAKINDLRIEQHDIDNAIISQAKNSPGQEMAILEFYKKNLQTLEYLKGLLLEEKTVQYIFDNEVTIIEKNYTTTELTEFLVTEEERAIHKFNS